MDPNLVRLFTILAELTQSLAQAAIPAPEPPAAEPTEEEKRAAVYKRISEVGFPNAPAPAGGMGFSG